MEHFGVGDYVQAVQGRDGRHRIRDGASYFSERGCRCVPRRVGRQRRHLLVLGDGQRRRGQCRVDAGCGNAQADSKFADNVPEPEGGGALQSGHICRGKVSRVLASVGDCRLHICRMDARADHGEYDRRSDCACRVDGARVFYRIRCQWRQWHDERNTGDIRC